MVLAAPLSAVSIYPLRTDNRITLVLARGVEFVPDMTVFNLYCMENGSVKLNFSISPIQESSVEFASNM